MGLSVFQRQLKEDNLPNFTIWFEDYCDGVTNQDLEEHVKVPFGVSPSKLDIRWKNSNPIPIHWNEFVSWRNAKFVPEPNDSCYFLMSVDDWLIVKLELVVNCLLFWLHVLLDDFLQGCPDWQLITDNCDIKNTVDNWHFKLGFLSEQQFEADSVFFIRPHQEHVAFQLKIFKYEADTGRIDLGWIL